MVPFFTSRPLSAGFSRAQMLGLATAALLSLGAALPAVAQQTLVVAAPQTPTGFDGDIPKVATRQMIVQANERS